MIFTMLKVLTLIAGYVVGQLRSEHAQWMDQVFLSDDECNQDTHGQVCALNAFQIQHTKERVVRFDQKPSRHHALRISDAKDYRADAAAFLQDALQRPGTIEGLREVRQQEQHSAKYDLEEFARSDRDSIGTLPRQDSPSNCDLPRMHFEEVERQWQTHLAGTAMRLAEGDTGTDGKEVLELTPNNTAAVLDAARTSFAQSLANGRPVLVEAVDRKLRWPASESWREDRIGAHLHGSTLQLESFDYPGWVIEAPSESGGIVEETVEEYLGSNQSARDLFLFMSENSDAFRGSKHAQETMEVLRDDYSPRPSFAHSAKVKHDIVAIDGIGSSHGFHSHESVWQVQVQGYKMWYLLPSDFPVTERDAFGDPKYGARVLVDGKPFNHPNACAFLKRVDPPREALKCIAGPGDMILLPTDYIHATCGLSNYTAAAGGWLDNYHAGR